MAERQREEARVRAAAAEGEAAVLREQVKAERDRAEARLRDAEAARDAARAELEKLDCGRSLCPGVAGAPPPTGAGVTKVRMRGSPVLVSATHTEPRNGARLGVYG